MSYFAFSWYLIKDTLWFHYDGKPERKVEEKSPVPGGIRSHYLERLCSQGKCYTAATTAAGFLILNKMSGFFSPMPCTYTSSPLDGKARNYIIICLSGYARSRTLLCLDPLCSYLLIPKEWKKHLGWAGFEPRSSCFTSNRSDHLTMATRATRCQLNLMVILVILAAEMFFFTICKFLVEPIPVHHVCGK